VLVRRVRPAGFLAEVRPGAGRLSPGLQEALDETLDLVGSRPIVGSRGGILVQLRGQDLRDSILRVVSDRQRLVPNGIRVAVRDPTTTTNERSSEGYIAVIACCERSSAPV
jgi:hypothetical protein